METAKKQEKKLLEIWKTISSDYRPSDPPLPPEIVEALRERESIYEESEWVNKILLQDKQGGYLVAQGHEEAPAVDWTQVDRQGGIANAQTILHRIERYAAMCIQAILLRESTPFAVRLLGQIKVRKWERETLSQDIVPLMPKLVAAEVVGRLAFNYPKYAWEVAEAPLFQGDAEGFLAIRILRARGNIRNDEDLSRARSAVMHQVGYWWNHKKFGERMQPYAIQAFLNLWRETSQRQDLQDAYRFCGMLTDPVIIADARVRIMSTTWETVDLIEAREAVLRIPDASTRAQQGLIMINNMVRYFPHAPDKLGFMAFAYSLSTQMPENWRALLLEKLKKAKQ